MTVAELIAELDPEAFILTAADDSSAFPGRVLDQGDGLAPLHPFDIAFQNSGVVIWP